MRREVRKNAANVPAHECAETGIRAPILVAASEEVVVQYDPSLFVVMPSDELINLFKAAKSGVAVIAKPFAN